MTGLLQTLARHLRELFGPRWPDRGLRLGARCQVPPKPAPRPLDVRYDPKQFRRRP